MRQLRIGTFNIQHSQPRQPGVTARAALETLCAELSALELDYIALQEVDAGLERSGNLDQPRLIAAALQMGWQFCPTLPGYGVAAFTRLPSESWCGRPLPIKKERGNFGNWFARSPEPRVWLGTRLALGNGEQLLLANTHLSVQVPLARAQLTWLTSQLAQMAGEGRPVILLGDLNLPPQAVAEAAPHWTALASGNTVPMPTPNRQIDHILGWNLAAANAENLGKNVQKLSVSDHAGLIAEIEI